MSNRALENPELVFGGWFLIEMLIPVINEVKSVTLFDQTAYKKEP
jgi:hypothetical protein